MNARSVNDRYEFATRALQAIWVLGGWMIPMIAFYLIFGVEEGYRMIFADRDLGLILSLASAGIFFLSLIGGILINIGDAQGATSEERLVYTLLLPAYPFFTLIRSILWIASEWRRWN